METGFNSNIVRVSILVLPAHPQPIVREDQANTTEDQAISIDVLINDENVTQIVSVDTPFHGTAVIQSGLILYTPDENYSGQDVFSYQAQGAEGAASARVVVDIAPLNDAPIANNLDSRITLGETAIIPVLASVEDPEGDTLQLISVTGAVNATVAIVDDTIIYTPTLFIPDSGEIFMLEQLAYTVRDSAGNESQAILFAYTFDNAVPVAIQDCYHQDANSGCITNTNYEIDIEQSKLLDVLNNDFDIFGDPLSLTQITSVASFGIALIQGDQVLYTPNIGVSDQTDSFEYQISDINSQTATTTVYLYIKAPDNTGNLPIAVDDCFDANSSAGCGRSDDYLIDYAGQKTLNNLLANDSDPNGESINIISLSSSAQGAIISQIGNTIVYQAPSNGPVADIRIHSPMKFKTRVTTHCGSHRLLES